MDVLQELDQLLTDDQDIIDLLQAYGVETLPLTFKERKEKLLQIIDGLGRSMLLSVVLSFAKKQASICQDIFDFCEKQETSIGGQLQVRTEGIFLERTSLNTRWAFGGRSRWTPETDARASSLANAIIGLADRLNHGEYTTTIQHEELTSFGRAIEGTIYGQLGLSGTRRRVEEQACSDADLATLSGVFEEVSVLKDKIRKVKMPPAISSAINDLESELNNVINEISSLEIVQGSEPNPDAFALLDEVQILFKEISLLAEDISEGQRVKEGLGQFIRSEFWAQRWRIYEVWLLISVLKALKSVGGDLELYGVDKGIWKLLYDRAEAPVASCSFPQGKINIYYQLFKQSTASIDMPDIVAIGPQGDCVFVLDSKHGYSYTRGKVRDALIKYGTRVQANMTAIINYFPASDYDFENMELDGRRWLIASNVAPRTLNAERFSLALADTLLSKGYSRDEEPMPITPVSINRSPRKSVCLLYWAREAREVDEPAGAWSVLEDNRVVALDLKKEDFDQILLKYHNANEYGSGVKYIGEGEAVSLSPSKRYRVVGGPWSKSGRESVKLLKIIDDESNVELPLVRFYGRLFYDIKWSPDESRFVFGVIPYDDRIWHSELGEERILLATLNEKHAVPVSMPRQRPSNVFGWVDYSEIKKYLVNNPDKDT